MAERVHLDRETELYPFLAQGYGPVEERLPVPVPREIVVGDEEAFDILGVVFANDRFEILGRAKTALAPLHVDDGAKGTMVGTAPAQVEARHGPGCAAHLGGRKNGHRLVGHIRQIGHEIVKGLESPFECVLQHEIEAVVLGFSSEETYP